MNMVKRFGTAALLMSLGFSLAGCTAKSDGFVPPKVGTQFTWKYVSEEGVDDELVTVVANGPDFVIFLQQSEQTTFAEFSGIGFADCTEDDMPSRADRQAVFSAWPLTVGAEHKWQTEKVLIEKEDVAKLGEQEEAVFWIYHDYEENDEDNFRYTVSPRYGTTIELEWQDGRDFVVSVTDLDLDTKEVQEGYTVLESFEVAKLGKCEALLSEKTPITAAANN